MLTHIFTSMSCARCRLCCNFRPCSAWETPFLEEALCEVLRNQGITLCSRPNGSDSFLLEFQTGSSEEAVNCPLLDPLSGCTLPREQRPFECRVWPLRLMQENGALCIGCYTACPALLEKGVREKLISSARGELLPILLDYARRFPQSVRAFDSAYEIIWHETADQISKREG